ncbi:hypothetical protein GYB57_13870 [bacterium]|nr:hypothetical protein [bacterium]
MNTQKLKTVVLLVFLSVNTTIFSQGLRIFSTPFHPFQKSSLNCSILNSSGKIGDFNITSNVYDPTGNLLMTEKAIVTLNESLNIISEGFLRGKEVNFIDNDFEKLFSLSNGFPPLNYKICIELKSSFESKSSYQECNTSEVNNLINILPFYPQNEMEVFETNPLFSWGVSNYNNLPFEYKLKVVKFDESKYRSINRGVPLIEISTLDPFFILPSQIPLENNENYVWQVESFLFGQPVASSEVFEFTKNGEERLEDIPKVISYVNVIEVDDKTPLIAIGKFKFKYLEETNDNILQIELFDFESGEKIKYKKKLLTVLGENKFEIDLSLDAYLKHNKLYKIKVFSKNMENSYDLSIKYINPDYIKNN